MHRHMRSAALAASLLTLGLVATGCAATPGTTATQSSGVTTMYGAEVPFNQKLHDALPQDVKDSGKLTFSTDAAAPPRAFVDDQGNLAGVIPDLLKAVGVTLGVKIDLQKNTFDTEVPGVQSRRFDATTGTGDFATRRAVLDMVDYYKAGYLYLVKAGNPKKVTDDPLSQCGLRVGMIKGTTQETAVAKLSDQCVAAGKPAIDQQSFNNVLLEVPLQSDRVDVVWENTSTGYQVTAESPDKFAVAGNPIFAAYLGFGISKDRTQLRDALQATLQNLLDSGVYKAIFTNWKQEALMMDKISTNSDVRP